MHLEKIQQGELVMQRQPQVIRGKHTCKPAHQIISGKDGENTKKDDKLDTQQPFDMVGYVLYPVNISKEGIGEGFRYWLQVLLLGCSLLYISLHDIADYTVGYSCWIWPLDVVVG